MINNNNYDNLSTEELKSLLSTCRSDLNKCVKLRIEKLNNNLKTNNNAKLQCKFNQ